MLCLQVVKVVQGRVPVFMDGGIRRGTDIFKALAMGAEAVLVCIYSYVYTYIVLGYFQFIVRSNCLLLWQIGRPVIYGLAAEGAIGVKKVLQMLSDELELAMALSGCCSLKDIKRSHVQVLTSKL